jgi:hypothetical protein
LQVKIRFNEDYSDKVKELLKYGMNVKKMWCLRPAIKVKPEDLVVLEDGNTAIKECELISCSLLPAGQDAWLDEENRINKTETEKQDHELEEYE